MDENDDAARAPRLGLRYAALSDVGRVRKDNQDSGYASEHLLVIADGVGGAARGDVASSTAVQALRRLDGPPPQDMLEALAGAIHRAHDRIAELVEEDAALEGTSTTVTAALFDGARLAVAHIGDSRGYLLRDGTLSQLTKDHTFVQSLIDEGRITEVESRSHPHRNLILRAVDGVHETDPDLFYLDLAPGDRLLLCSDGASGVLDPERLADILGSGSLDYAVVELIRASLEAGSSDNVTCVVADVVDADAPVDEETSAAASTGPMLVGAAAEQPRRAGGQPSKTFFRGHRGGDTGEIDPVPGEESADGAGGGPPSGGGSDDPEALRYAPRAPRGRRGVKIIVVLLALVLVAAAAAVLGYRWTQDQYFVAEDGANVAIYRGVQADLPGMNHVEQRTDVTLASLPDFPAEQVRSGIAADSLGDARQIVSRLTEAARVCPTPTPTPAPSPSATATRKPGATPRPSPSPTPTPTPTPSPSPTLAPPDCIEAAS